MEEAKKSGAAGAAQSQTDPVVEPAVRTFVAVSLQRRLTQYSSTLPATWTQANPEQRKAYLQRVDDSMRVWTVRELAGFRGVDLPEKFTPQDTRRLLKELIRPDSKVKDIKPAIKRTPEEIKAARQQLTIKAFGARLLRGPSGWLSLSPELRESASRNFDHELQKWVGNQKIGSQVRQLSVQTWVEHRERKSAASRGDERKSAASVRKNTTPDVER